HVTLANLGRGCEADGGHADQPGGQISDHPGDRQDDQILAHLASLAAFRPGSVSVIRVRRSSPIKRTPTSTARLPAYRRNSTLEPSNGGSTCLPGRVVAGR